MANNDNPVIAAAMQYERDTTKYVTMRQIGKQLGVSSHVVGRMLKQVGVRDADGHPTEEVRSSNLNKIIFTEQGFPLTLWHQDRALAILRPLIEPIKPSNTRIQ